MKSEHQLWLFPCSQYSKNRKSTCETGLSGRIKPRKESANKTLRSFMLMQFCSIRRLMCLWYSIFGNQINCTFMKTQTLTVLFNKVVQEFGKKRPVAMNSKVSMLLVYNCHYIKPEIRRTAMFQTESMLQDWYLRAPCFFPAVTAGSTT